LPDSFNPQTSATCHLASGAAREQGGAA